MKEGSSTSATSTTALLHKKKRGSILEGEVLEDNHNSGICLLSLITSCITHMLTASCAATLNENLSESNRLFGLLALITTPADMLFKNIEKRLRLAHKAPYKATLFLRAECFLSTTTTGLTYYLYDDKNTLKIFILMGLYLFLIGIHTSCASLLQTSTSRAYQQYPEERGWIIYKQRSGFQAVCYLSNILLIYTDLPTVPTHVVCLVYLLLTLLISTARNRYEERPANTPLPSTTWCIFRCLLGMTAASVLTVSPLVINNQTQGLPEQTYTHIGFGLAALWCLCHLSAQMGRQKVASSLSDTLFRYCQKENSDASLPPKLTAQET